MYAASFPSSSDHEDGSSSSDDTEVDETLVRELRESLHFCVGKICRAEELAAASNQDDDESDNGMTTSISKKTDTVMSKEAIAALTELAYHYSTSSLANDLCAFSNHGNRRTVKADDVLLVARKEKHILAELKRKVAASQPAAESGNKGGNSTAKAAAAGSKKKKNTNNTRKTSNPLFNSNKKKAAKSMMLDSSSSSSSDSDSDVGVDPMEKIRQRRLELKQKNLNNTAYDRAKNNDDSSSSSSSSDGLDFSIGKSTTNSKMKGSSKSKGTVDTQDDMVIDLADSD
eukprot:scaffold2707_cov90-Skeletonema_dohrnii-CCMP3373.AAC.9